MNPEKNRIAILANGGAREDEKRLIADLRRSYPSAPEDAEVLISVGGNSRMLRALHKWAGSDKRLYGLSASQPNFLTNHRDRLAFLADHIGKARGVRISPLRARSENGATRLAFNEIAVMRASRRMIVVDVEMFGQKRIQLRGDGIIVSTPFGSSAYNRAAGGPIVPVDAPIILLTPVALAEPVGWRGAILPNDSRITLKVRTDLGGPADMTADHHEAEVIDTVCINVEQEGAVEMLFDVERDFQHRQIMAQFSTGNEYGNEVETRILAHGAIENQQEP